ncbi:MAG: hypothetical protein AB7U83_03400 [Vicinamibacterales bacterium]
MQRRRFVAWLFGALAVAGRELHACGDKFLVASRGTRFQRAGLVRQPAAVAIYAPPGSPMAFAVDGLGLEPALAKIGYRPTRVVGPDALRSAAAGGTADLLVVDLADAATLDGVVATERTAVVAVAFAADKDALSRARRAHDAVIRRPSRTRVVVDAIDDVLFERAIRARSVRRAGK